MAELADAQVSGTCGLSPCRFDSYHPQFLRPEAVDLRLWVLAVHGLQAQAFLLRCAVDLAPRAGIDDVTDEIAALKIARLSSFEAP